MALTGVDTDRLKEEKRRGMTIEPGFAYADLGNGDSVGFVDVPGHERFVRNMLTGVAFVDFALLVVAADDGPMPQTHEHLAILELLGIRRGAVALTKIDRVAPERTEEVRAQIAALLAESSLQGAPVFPVAANTGRGVAALRSHLADVAKALPVRATHGNFRLAVDRSFSVAGAGLIVTGAVFSGTARIGDHLLISPAGTPVRVRGIRAHNQRAELATVGHRCALNLTGSDLKRTCIERGDWIVAAAVHAPTERLDVRLKVVGSRALSHWAPMHLHIGTTDVSARVALLDARAIEPGCTGLAQLVVDRPIAALHGDRFILRDQSAQQTVAGGVVIDPSGATRGRGKPERLLLLAAMEKDTVADALESLLAVQQDGVPLGHLAQAWNLTPNEASELFARQPIVTFDEDRRTLGVATARWQSVCEQLCATLREWHTEYPDALGATEAMLAGRLGMRMFSPVWRAASKALCEEGLVVREAVCLRLHDHRARLSEGDATLLGRVSSVLQSAGRRPPAIGELAGQLDMDQAILVEFLERAARLGHVVCVARNRFFLPAALDELARIAAQLADESEGGVFDAASYRDRSGIGRNLAIEVLEFMDRARITRFSGGRRRMLA